jgi:hypothetical protein
MTSREKRLAGAVAAVGLLWGGMKGVDRYRSALEANQTQERQAVDALDDAEFAEARGERAKRRLIDWGKRSLPTDRDVAKSLYHDWLRKELTAAGLTVEQLADKPLGRANPSYGELAVDIRAVGTLEQLTNFLYKFYSTPHLHRISTATVTASEAGAKLTAALGIDALILTESTRKDALAEGEALPLPQPLEDIRTSLVSRNVFAPHTGKPADSGDEASKAFVRMFIYGDGGYMMQVKIDEPAKTRYFRQGERIEFGKFAGEVVEIDISHAVIKTDSGVVEVRIGQNLGEATPVPAEET